MASVNHKNPTYKIRPENYIYNFNFDQSIKFKINYKQF